MLSLAEEIFMDLASEMKKWIAEVFIGHGVVQAINLADLPENEGPFGGPNFKVPTFTRLRHVRFNFSGEDMKLLLEVKRVLPEYDLRLIDGVTASRESHLQFSEIWSDPADVERIGNLNNAEEVLKEVKRRNSDSWDIGVESWSRKRWISNSDGSHRICIVLICSEKRCAANFR